MGLFFSSPFDTKYQANLTNIKQVLDTYGICYIPNILDDEEHLDMVNGTWNFLEHITMNDKVPLSRANKSTWPMINDLMPNKGMMFQLWNAGHSQHMWDLRQNETIIEPFTKIFNCEMTDLLVSFDGFSLCLPPEFTKIDSYKPGDKWYHMDQRLDIYNFDGVQSFVNAYDIEDNDSTFIFFEKSHLLTREFSKHFDNLPKGDWVPLEQKHVDFYKNRCEEVALKCPKNSLVIWDSRLVHCNVKPKLPRAKPNIRCVAYLSYSLRSKATKEALEMKKYALNELFTTNHYAHRPSIFQTVPGNIIPYEEMINYINPIPRPILTKLGYILAGYTEQEIDDIINN